MPNAVVLGSGLIGTTIAIDLAANADWQVTVVDARQGALQDIQARARVSTHCIDLRQPSAVRTAVADADIVVGALSSRLGFQTLRAVIEAGRNYCDISFMAEDATELDDLAKKAGVTAVVDCGVAPGVSNMIAGHVQRHLAPCEALAIYVGGLPMSRALPYEYKAGFAPADVIEEYTRPARVVEQGKIVTYTALEEVEQLHFDEIGTLEAFVTDGLRSLAYTLSIPNMIEKTIRYPGHAALMKTFRELGLFGETAIDLSHGSVTPLELTSKLLFPKWKFGPKEADFTVMRIIADGLKQGKHERHTWNLIDRYDPFTDIRSMSRTTAFPASIVAKAIVEGRFGEPGVHPPETLGAIDELFEHVLAELRLRGVCYERSVEVMAQGTTTG